MGTGTSKKGKKGQSPSKSSKPKTMPYKRQFSSDAARQNQKEAYKIYRQSTLDDDKKESNNEDHADNNKENKSSQNKKKSKNYNDILDPEKYQPPPSPAVPDNALTISSKHEENNFVKRKESIKEEEDEIEMTDDQYLIIQQSSQRALSPGTNLLDNNDHENEDQNDSTDNQLPNRAHSRVESHKLDHNILNNFQVEQLLWGYCELTRKQLDEDQAAFLTWSHPIDGFVHSWAIFDGHGGYETALYSSQHFLKYVQKYHMTRIGDNKMKHVSEWNALLKEVFIRFDEHIGNLNIRGGSTAQLVLLIKNTLIVANAGDARAIMSHRDGKAIELSYDHSPMNDYDRLYKLCKTKENYKKINKFFRLNGKNETYSDIQKLAPSQVKKAPFISREQDKSRLLGTIGVARGFGDFNLSVFGFKSIKLKPFLSAEPYIFIKELKEVDILETDIMCIACDGVFDVMTNQEVIDILRREMYFKIKKDKNNEIIKEDKETDQNNHHHEKDKSKLYTDQPDLDIDSNIIDRACGFLGLRSYAKGTMDDVSVFAVPLKQIFEFNKLNSTTNE